MTIEKVNLPVGRIVNGHPTKMEHKTNMQTKQVVIGKDGQPVPEWRIKIAYPKDVFNKEVWPLLAQEATIMYPQIAQGVYPPNFSWKFVDGDSPQCPKGSKVPYNQRDGYKGNMVVTIVTNAFAPPVYKYENGSYRQIAENEIKCGDYVVPNVTIKAHADGDGGLYINPNGYELVGYGQPIASVGAADPQAMFGGAVHQLPAGASAMPVGAPAGMGMPAAQMPMGAPAGMGMPAAQMPAPAYDFVQNAGSGFPAAPAVNAQAPVPQMGNGIAQGVTSSPISGMPPIPQR